MKPALIYLDTNLWNQLCDQRVDPLRMVETLARKNACLALGNEVAYELSKTFIDSDSAGHSRGMTLFSYVHQYLLEQIPVVRVNLELVAAEMWALRQGAQRPEISLNSHDYEITCTEIERLSRGEVSDRIREYIEKRVASAQAHRSAQISHLKSRPDLKQQLIGIRPEHLLQWMEKETRSYIGQEQLAWQLGEYFPEAPADEMSDWARALLESPLGRVSRAIVRRNLYYNWRCAHRESVSKDVYFDTNHVLNASYADVYATKEPRQIEYAELLLTSATEIAIYDGSEGVEQWLSVLAEGLDSK